MAHPLQANRLFLRDRMGCDLMSFAMHLLDCRVVGVLVRNEESAFDRTSIWVISALFEKFLINVNVVVIDGVVERDHDHLRHLGWFQLARNLGPIR